MWNQTMVELHLDYLLDRVDERFRRYAAWRRLAWFWIIAVPLVVVTWGISRTSEHSADWILPFYLLTVLVGGGVLFWVVRRRRHDPLWLARRIEARHPDLNALLLTAVEQRKVLPTARGYLQQRVIHQAVEHARNHDWRDTLSNAKIHRAQFAQTATLLLLVAVTGWLWMLTPEKAAAMLPGLLGETAPTAIEYDIQVEPGDVEIERGTSLVVTARFGKTLPADVHLAILPAEGEPLAEPMQKSLEDPLFGARIAIVEEDLRYTVKYDDRQSDEFTVKVFEYPRLLQADARVDYPDYTGTSPLEMQDIRQVTAVEGSTVTLNFQLNKPVTAAVLSGNGAADIVLEPVPGGENAYTTTIVLSESRNYTLQLTDDAGRRNKQPPTISLNALPNRPPEIKLTFPGRDQRVSPLEEMLVTATITDDFGVVARGISYTMGDAAPQTVTIDGLSGATQPLEHLMRMEDLDAQPDQLLSYYVWAEDYGPDGQVRRTESDMYFAEVRHFEEIFRQGQSAGGGGGPQGGQSSGQGQQMDDLIRMQKQIVTATWNLRRNSDTAAGDKFADELLVITQSQQTAADQLAEVQTKLRDPEAQAAAELAAQQMAAAIDQLGFTNSDNAAESLLTAHGSERAAYQALLKLRAREHEVTRGQQGGGGGGSGGRSQQQLQQLELTDQENRYQNRSTAQSQQSDAQREANQVLNRLRELARRQSDLNERIKELQSALQAAQDEQERKELERRLKRLREEQRELLRNADELRDRMQQSPQQAESQQTQQQVAETRENMRRASEALEQGQLSQALNEGTRAERQLQQLRDEFREKSAGAFADEMQQMRDDARELAEQEQKISEELNKLNEGEKKSLRDVRQRDELGEQLSQQQKKLQEVLEQLREVSQAAEQTEPLLSKQLYDTLRNTEQKQPGRALDVARQQLQRGWADEAAGAERHAAEAIDQLKSGVERAAESVLGNETEALQRANQELADLARQLNEEIARANPQQQSQEPSPQEATHPGPQASTGQQQQQQQPGQQRGQQPGQQPPPGQSQGQGRPDGQPSERGEGQRPRQGSPVQQASAERSPQQPGEQQPGEQQPGEQQSGGQQPGGQQPGGQQPGGQQAGGQQPGGQQPGQGASPNEQSTAESRGGQPRQRPNLRDRSAQQSPGRPSPGVRNESSEQTGGGGPGGPITGGDFRQWSDRLRDVEEMVEDPDLRERVAQIRDRARSMRAEFKRHSQEPNWSLVESLVAEPLVELQDRLREEIAKRESPDALVPIDRDPVPPEYSEIVRRYYERLGSGQ